MQWCEHKKNAGTLDLLDRQSDCQSESQGAFPNELQYVSLSNYNLRNVAILAMSVISHAQFSKC